MVCLPETWPQSPGRHAVTQPPQHCATTAQVIHACCNEGLLSNAQKRHAAQTRHGKLGVLRSLRIQVYSTACSVLEMLVSKRAQERARDDVLDFQRNAPAGNHASE